MGTGASFDLDSKAISALPIINKFIDRIEVKLPRLKSGASYIIPPIQVSVAQYPLYIDILHNP